MSLRHWFVMLLISGLAFGGEAHRKMEKEVKDHWKTKSEEVAKACGCKEPFKVNIDWKSYHTVDKTKVDGTRERLVSELTSLAEVYTKFCSDTENTENKAVACKAGNKTTVELKFGGIDGGKIDAKKKVAWEFSDDSSYTAGYKLKELVEDLD